jgi:deoxyribose-phosphate aldolase
MIDLANADNRSIATAFDYSILAKNTTAAEVREGCRITRQYGFAAFYTSSPYFSPIVAEELAGADIEVGTGIAFPFGSQTPAVKAFETEEAIARGCTAVDMVMNIGALKDGDLKTVRQELTSFVAAAGSAVTRCILEVNFLSDQQIATGCKLIAECGVQWAKTSSGQFDGPTLEQFLVMRDTLADTDIKLKVAGVKFPRPQNAYVFILAGAERIGTRAAPEIVDAFDSLRQLGLIPGPTE